jgi:hypothetical protein
MKESANSAPRSVSEILNTSYDELEELIIGISSDREELHGYIQTMRRLSPELAKQAGGWIGIFRESIPLHGVAKAVRAEGAFTSGNAMMYELLRRAVLKRNLPVPDTQFMADSLIDTELLQGNNEWLIDLSFRGQDLFRNHPAFFEAALEMFSKEQGRYDVTRLKEMLFSPPDPNDFTSFDLVHYLMGAAEVILPVERQAQVAALEQ